MRWASHPLPVSIIFGGKSSQSGLPVVFGTFRFSRLFSETRFTSQLKRQTKSQYEAFALGEVGKEAYLAAKASLRQKEETLSEQIAKLELSIEQTNLAESNGDGLAVRLQSYLDVKQLTEDILDGLVEQVLVFPDGRLEILWKFRDELERLRQAALG